ncbi:MAG: hypothetical protein FWC39_06890 [Bacteroidetes bacterium]|nr:hypothetical protein [Bacteroidota bacterium]
MPNLKPLTTLIILLLSIHYTYSQSQAELLEKAYKENSTELLKEFFCTWHQEVPPFTDAELLEWNDTLFKKFIMRTILPAHKAFIAFYQPQNLAKIDGSKYGENDTIINILNCWRNNNEFLILDAYITPLLATLPDTTLSEQEIKEYLTKETNREWHLSDTIEVVEDEKWGIFRTIYIDKSGIEFQPAIRFDNKTLLFYSYEYEKIINYFLGLLPEFSGWYDFPVPIRSQQCIEKRKDFLENYVKMYPGNFGNWLLRYSSPIAPAITFDKNMQYAVIDFHMYCEGYDRRIGGIAFLKNENGEWKFISAELIYPWGLRGLY